MYPLVSFGVLLMLWQWGVRAAGVPEYILPLPSEFLAKLWAEGPLIAEHTLETFMVHGWLDEPRCIAGLSEILCRAGTGGRRVRAFGEMVTLLWNNGHRVKKLGIEPDAAEVSMLPQNYLKLEGKQAQQMVRLMEALDDHDDIRHVWSNFDIEEKEIEASLA